MIIKKAGVAQDLLLIESSGEELVYNIRESRKIIIKNENYYKLVRPARIFFLCSKFLLFYGVRSHFYINVLSSSLIKKYATIPKILPTVPAIFNNLSVVICNPNNRCACSS